MSPGTSLKKLAVLPQSKEAAERALELAERLGLEVTQSEKDSEYILLVSLDEVSLKKSGDKMKPVRPDFLKGEVGFRVRFAKGPEMLLKAVGGCGSVCDLTAGFGQDAFVLRTRGCTVTMLERSPVIFALLSDAIDRAKKDPRLKDLLGTGFRLICGDSTTYLEKSHETFDAIYFDPMFPGREKSALPKKEMQILASLVDKPSQFEINAIYELAKKRTKRFVVKRPAKAQPLIDSVSMQILGSSTRFDVYIFP